MILGVYRELGAIKLFEALTLMSQSEFVKNNLSVNAIFKIENLKKALNGNFKDKVKKNKVEKKYKKDNKEEKPEEYYSEKILSALKEVDNAKV